MYVNSFWFGVGCTLFVEFILCTALILFMAWRKGKRDEDNKY